MQNRPLIFLKINGLFTKKIKCLNLTSGAPKQSTPLTTMKTIYPNSLLRPWFLFVPLPFSLLLIPAILLLWLTYVAIAGVILWYGMRLNFGHAMGYIIMNAIICVGTWKIRKRFEEEEDEYEGKWDEKQTPLLLYALFGSLYFWREVIEIIWLFLFIDFWEDMRDKLLGPTELLPTT